MCSSPLKLQTYRGYVLSIFIALQHPFMFKYQVYNNKYVKFLIPINQTNLFSIGSSLIYFLGYGKAFIWPIGGEGVSLKSKLFEAL